MKIAEKMLRVLLFLFVVRNVVSSVDYDYDTEGSSEESRQLPHSYEVSIRFANRYICNGAIISPKHILTAAHCFTWGSNNAKYPKPALKYMSVVSGIVPNSSREGNRHMIKDVTIQSDFGYKEMGVWHSDIAVVTLESTIKYSPYEQPIKFPSKDLGELDKAIVSTWDTPSDDLKTVLVNLIIPHEKCAQKLKEKYLGEHDNKICGFTTKGRGLCLNIDGSPLVQEGVIIGVGSSSKACENGQPDVYVNVYRNRAFIKRVMAADLQ